MPEIFLENEKQYLDIINQVFEIEKKISKLSQENSIQRNIKKLKSIFEHELGYELSLTYHSPIGESYNETRTDCEASIAGTCCDNLIITEVVKPIIRIRFRQSSIILQKAVVIAQSNGGDPQ